MRKRLSLALLLLLVGLYPLSAAITEVGTGLVQNTSQTGTASITVPADCTFILLGISGDGNSGDYDPSYVKVNNVGMTKILNVGSGGYTTNWMYYLPSPATGEQTFAWAWPNAMGEGVSYLFVFLKGVDPSIPIGDSDRGEAPNALTLTTVSGSVVYGCVTNYEGAGDASPADSGQEDAIALESAYNSDWGGIGKEVATGASVTFSFTAPSYGTCIAVALNEARDPATFYLSDSDGDDGYDGLAPAYTSGTSGPFKTLAMAESVLRAGDTLYIRAGTYTGPSIVVNFDASGTAQAPIVIDNYQSEAVVIDGQDTYPTGSVYNFLITLSGDYITIRDIVITNSHGSLLNMSGDNCRAINITGITSREAGMLASGTGNIYDTCSMTGCGSGYGIDGQTTWGSAIGTNGTNCIIRNCLAQTNTGEGFNTGGAASGCTVEDCIAYNNDSVNIYVDSADNSLIQRNLVYDTREAPGESGITIGAEVGQPSDVRVINNLVMGCFINLHVDGNVTALTNVQIAHNVFINAKGNLSGYDMGVYIRASVSSFTGSSFRNNIVIEDSAGRVPISVAESHDGLTFSNNCWNKTAVAGAQGTGDVTGDAGLAKAGALTAGDLTGDYFKLLSGSPCVDAGANLAINQDYFGGARPEGSGYDIGAHELSSSSNSIIRKVTRSVMRDVKRNPKRG